MKIALIGYGKMGQLIEKIAIQNDHVIIAKTTSTCFDPKLIQDAEICIDFSHPDAVLTHVEQIAKMGIPIVMGTTGWHQHIQKIQSLVTHYDIGFLHSPNFSIGVNLFLQMIKSAAILMDQFDQYDVGMSEVHHKHKVDSPSGTAQNIANTLLNKIKRKKGMTINSEHSANSKDLLHISTLRCGSIPGTHSVIFDSNEDTITLTHEARNREGFARGALVAAEWLKGKKGFFTMDQLLEEII